LESRGSSLGHGTCRCDKRSLLIDRLYRSWKGTSCNRVLITSTGLICLLLLILSPIDLSWAIASNSSSAFNRQLGNIAIPAHQSAWKRLLSMGISPSHMRARLDRSLLVHTDEGPRHFISSLTSPEFQDCVLTSIPSRSCHTSERSDGWQWA
jgi:hypothetical protein